MRSPTIVLLFLYILLGIGDKVMASPTPALGEAYLSQWFSIDTDHSLNVKLSPVEDNKTNHWSLEFTNDEGQIVSGTIAYPTRKTQVPKLALLLHPMGVDQQLFWWSEKSPLKANSLTAKLLTLGYTVASLDAREHGRREVKSFSSKDIIKKARSDAPRLYIDIIIGTVRDYRLLLHWAEENIEPTEILVAGYSMGAQMGLLLASYEPSVSAVLAMVPPYVTQPTSPVAPRVHTKRIHNAKVLWLAGEKDPYSTQQQTEYTFNKISSTRKKITWFDSGHRLPAAYIKSATDFFHSLQSKE